MPVIGDYLYDLLSAVLSNVDIIKKLYLDEVFDLVDEPKNKMIICL